MSIRQLAVRLDAELMDVLDDLVRRGAFPSRSAAVRAGIEALAERIERVRIDEQIIDGYRRFPPTPAEDAAAVASLRHAILEEPW